MNWKQILTEHTGPAIRTEGYFQTKRMDTDLYNDVYHDAKNWSVCPVGSFMQDLISNWDDAGSTKQYIALENIQTYNGIRLYQYGNDFFNLIEDHDIAGARKCYDVIESIVNRMDETDIGRLADFLNSPLPMRL